MYGLPEREDTFVLKETGQSPYELFTTPHHSHTPNDPAPLYGAIPYVTSISETASTGITWVNAAQTWTTIHNTTISEAQEGRFVNFVSESGALEVFVFASANDGMTNRAKKVQLNLA